MKNTQSFIKLICVAAYLAAALACGSPNQTGGNSPNVSAGNTVAAPSNVAGNTAPNAETKTNKRDPKLFCNYLTDFVNGEYKEGTLSYQCLGKKTEKLSSGREQEWRFTAEGDAENVKSIMVSLIDDGKYKDAAEGDEKLVEISEKLWMEVFKTVLPSDIRDAILKDKGKAVEKRKEFTEPTKGYFWRRVSGSTSYGIIFKFDLPE